MKMTLNQLQIDSYCAQMSENELTEVKGGTTPICLVVAAAVLLTSCTEEKDCIEVTTTSCPDGGYETSSKEVACDE